MPDRRLVRRLNLHFSLLWALYWLGWAALWGYLSVFLLHRGFTNSQIGLVSSCALLLPIVVQPALASLTDRDSRFTGRRLAMVLTALSMVCGGAVWLVDSSAVCAVLLVVIGVALTAIAPYFNAMSMDFVLRGLDVDFGASRSCGSVSYAATSLVMGALLERFTPTLVLPVFLISFAALFLALLLFRYPLPVLSVGEAKIAPTVLSNAALLRHYPRFTLLLVACFLLMGSQSAITTYMIHIADKVGGGETATGTAYFISGLMEMPAMLLFARVRRKVSLKTLMMLCSVAFVVRAAAFLLAGSTIAMYAACSVQFFAYAVLAISTVYYVTEEIDTANQVKGQALIYTASSGIGAAFGSLMGGRLLDLGGANAMLTFCILSGCAGVAVMALTLYGRRKTPPHPTSSSYDPERR